MSFGVTFQRIPVLATDAHCLVPVIAKPWPRTIKKTISPDDDDVSSPGALSRVSIDLKVTIETRNKVYFHRIDRTSSRNDARRSNGILVTCPEPSPEQRSARGNE